jgi:fumarylpyruvate hydrolase
MTFIFPPAATPALAITGLTELFPVNRIFCVGRNYAAHAREMGMDPDKEPPFFFMKPATALVPVSNADVNITYPPMTGNYHHEVELVVAIKTGGADINVKQAHEHVYGYAIGLDMTRRDLQTAASKKGQPWEFGKSFSASAPIGPVHPVTAVGYITNAAITLEVNGKLRQSSNINQLIWPIPEVIAYLSQYEPLQQGDLIMTGTPEGVGPVVAGEEMRAKVSGLGEIVVRVIE